MGRRLGGLCTLVVLITVAHGLWVALGAPTADLVPSLPGQPEVAFQQYAGYITVDKTNGRNLFYYFVEAATDSKSKPLTLWLNGGPGCSSLGGGFSELGPFYPSTSGQGLISNNNSWNQVSNIIFLESPAGVGFSYSDTPSDYNTNDEKTAQDALYFLLGWLAKYPEYQMRDFYITGESYAGHYVPQLAAAIVKNNQVAGQLKIQLKGIMVGNPLFDKVTDLEYAPVEYAWGHGMVSQATYDVIVRQCKFSSSVPENQACEDAQNLAMHSQSTLYERNHINPYDVLEDVCLGDISQQALILVEMRAGRKLNVDPCIDDEETVYLNLAKVQTALHAKPTQWSICSDVLNYDYSDLDTEMLPVLAGLLKNGLRVWVFSGDADAMVPVVGTRKLVNTLADELKLSTSSDYQPWFQGKQVGGWSVSWRSLVFSTVRGAGHMVPQTQPARGLQLFSSFIDGTTPPVAPTKL